MRLDTVQQAWDITRMIDFRSFTPSEAAKVSGVNVALQRDWRRRGILPAIEGRVASFSPFEIGKLMALNALAEQGLSPLGFRGVANKLGVCIVHRALLSPEAWTGAYANFIPFDVKGLEELERDAGHPRLQKYRDLIPSYVESWRRNYLARFATGNSGYTVDGLSVFVQFAEGSFDFFRSAIEPFEQIGDDDARMEGTVITLRLDVLGRTFVKRAGAFAHIEDRHADVRHERNGIHVVAERMAKLGWAAGQSDA